MGSVLKTSYQSVSDTGNIQKTRKKSGAPPTTQVTGLRAWLRMKHLAQIKENNMRRRTTYEQFQRFACC